MMKKQVDTLKSFGKDKLKQFYKHLEDRSVGFKYFKEVKTVLGNYIKAQSKKTNLDSADIKTPSKKEYPLNDMTTLRRIYRKANDTYKNTEGSPPLDNKGKRELKRRLANLNEYANDFLILQTIKENPSINLEILGLIYKVNPSFNKFIKVLEETSDMFSSQSFVDNKLCYQYEKGKLIQLEKENLLLDRTKNNLELLDEALDRYYLENKLLIQHAKLSTQNIINKKFNINSSVIDLLTPTYNDNPYIRIYYIGYQILKNSEHGELNKEVELLEKLLDEHENLFTKQQLTDLYIILSNYYVKQDFRIIKTARTKLLNLYKTRIKKDLFEKQLVEIINLISLSCREGDSDYAEQIQKRFRKELKNEPDYDYISLATIAFYRQKFDEAEKYCNDIKFRDRDGKMDINIKVYYRILLQKTCYEKDKFEEDEALTHFEQIRKWLDENPQINEAKKKAYKNFNKILKSLYKIKFKKDRISEVKFKEELQQLRRQLLAQELNSDPIWLLEKTQELEDEVS